MAVLQRNDISEVGLIYPTEEESWHAVSVNDAMTAQESGPSGLTDAEARERLARFGPNRLPPSRRRGLFLRFFAQFSDALIYVLLGATVVTALLGHWVDAQVIFAVVLINAIIGFVQEGKAENALEAIRDMLAPKASVIREGLRKTVPRDELVPGDIVLLEIFYLFSVRYLKASSITWHGMLRTPAVLIAVGTVIALQVVFTYAPFMESFFDTRPLSLSQGVQIVAAGFATLLILEFEKWIQSLITRRRHGRGEDSQKTAQTYRER